MLTFLTEDRKDAKQSEPSVPTTNGAETSKSNPTEEVTELHSRIEELQAAMAAMKFERDSLLHSNQVIEDADVELGSEVGSICSWDSITDDRDERYNELLKRHMKVMSDLAEKVGIFKSVLMDARTEYEELLAQHKGLQQTHDLTVQELERLKFSMNRTLAGVPESNGLSIVS